jgi:hypothetical protein
MTIKSNVRFKHGRAGSKRIVEGTQPASARTTRMPRIAKLMALAIHFERLLRDGKVRDYAEIARLGHVTRARVTQIMNLLNLAPDIQDALLFLPAVEAGRDPIKEWQVRPVAAEAGWKRQQQIWRRVLADKPATI